MSSSILLSPSAQLLLLLSSQRFSLFFTSYSQTACATVLIYDILLLFPTEINYVWLPRPLHPRLLLFAFNRYSPLVDTALTINWILQTATPALCHRFYSIVSPFVLIGIFTSQVILMIRTYAIWDRSRAIFWCFIGTGILCFIPGVVCIAIALKTTQCGLLVIRASSKEFNSYDSQSSHCPMGLAA